MAKQEISDILAQLHHSEGLPRLEIEGIEEPSVDARFLKLFYHEGKKGDSIASCLRRPLDIIPEEKAVYIIKDSYEEASYVTDFDIICTHIPKSALESLVKAALESGSNEATASVEGVHETHRERWNDFVGTHDGGPPVYFPISLQLSLKIVGGRPSLSVEYNDRRRGGNDMIRIISDRYGSEKTLIEIPKKGGLEWADERLSKYVKAAEESQQSAVAHVPNLSVTEFTDSTSVTCTRPLPAVRVFAEYSPYLFYMLWIEEREEWVGIEFKYAGSHFEDHMRGVEKDPPSASGPYKLNLDYAKLIKDAYKNQNIPLKEVLHTEPSKLKSK